jgi:hypothetical protein
MSINIKRLLNSELGKILLSILLGLGLSTIFKQSCSGQSCITYHGPILGQIEDKVYQYGERCYKYTIAPIQCSTVRRSVDLSNEIDDPTANLAAPEPAPAKSFFSFM